MDNIGPRWLFRNRPVNVRNRELNVDYFRKRELPQSYLRCPEEYLQKLELRKYATNTARTYIGLFEGFINHYEDRELINLDENDIRVYLQQLVQLQKSDSYLHQTINALKRSTPDSNTR